MREPTHNSTQVALAGYHLAGERRASALRTSMPPPMFLEPSRKVEVIDFLFFAAETKRDRGDFFNPMKLKHDKMCDTLLTNKCTLSIFKMLPYSTHQRTTGSQIPERSYCRNRHCDDASSALPWEWIIPPHCLSVQSLRNP